MERQAFMRFLAVVILAAFFGSAAAQTADPTPNTPREDRLLAKASKLGFQSVLFDHSVAYLVSGAIDSALPIEKLKNIAIETGAPDQGFVAMQILRNHEALFRHEDGPVRLIVHGYKGTIYEGTSLASLPVSFWRITGVRSYDNVAGATSEAFVIEPAW